MWRAHRAKAVTLPVSATNSPWIVGRRTSNSWHTRSECLDPGGLVAVHGPDTEKRWAGIDAADAADDATVQALGVHCHGEENNTVKRRDRRTVEARCPPSDSCTAKGFLWVYSRNRFSSRSSKP